MRTTTTPHEQLQTAKLRDAPDEVYEGVGCTRQQSKAARNDSRGVFVNSKLRPSRTKNSENRKTISFHAREPSAMATSPVKRRLSPKNCSSPGRCLIYSWNVAKHLRKRKLRSRVRHWAQTRAKKVKKTLDFCFFAFFFLKLRNTEHARKSLTIFSSRMCRLPKRLRASA